MQIYGNFEGFLCKNGALFRLVSCNYPPDLSAEKWGGLKGEQNLCWSGDVEAERNIGSVFKETGTR